MKQGIHPNYYQAKVVCNCGNEFVTGSTKKDIHVEICSKCHSFYTGQQKAASARGRIEMFIRKYGMKTDKSGLISERLSFWITLKTQPFLSYRESRRKNQRKLACRGFFLFDSRTNMNKQPFFVRKMSGL